MPVPDGVKITYEESQRITWYTPKFEPWKMFDFRIYPSIAKADDGARKIGLSIVVKDPPGGRPTSLRMVALWSAAALPAAPPKVDKAGPPAGAHAAGKGNVTNPELIPSSKVLPKYPRFAHDKRFLGRVVLQAIVHKDGSVGDIEVLKGAGGDCGFEETAIDAVSKWRYKPATLNGQPVDVYFTVVVDFTYGDYRMAPG